MDHDPESDDALAVSGTALAERLLAVLFSSGESMPMAQLCEFLDVPAPALEECLPTLERLLSPTPLTVRRVAQGLQLVLTGPAARWMETAVARRAPARLSAAAWETLAVVVYRQPVTRLEIEAARGVNSDHALDTLVDRGLVAEAGRKDVPGRPVLYATTDRFLEVFGVEGLDQLPPLPQELMALDDAGGDEP